MITAQNTNTVYLSRLLHSDDKYSDACDQLTGILDKHAIPYKFLEKTKDIWCRDYMPIQVNKGEFVQFRYEPTYLKDELEKQSDPVEVCKVNNINPKFSKINLDGGNVVNWSDKAIISDRVYKENPDFNNKSKLISDIEKLLGVEVIVIPAINWDMTGHADGMVRFFDHNTILGSDRNQEYKYWSTGINKILKEHNLYYKDMPFFEYKFKEKEYRDNAIGCYVNFLEVGNLVVVPIFEIDGNKDKEALTIFQRIFKGREIETINFNAVGLHGGLLNCATWTIME